MSNWSDSISPAWERHRERLFEGQRSVSEWLVEQVEPRPGQTMLEVTAGPGETGFLVAERLGPKGKLLSTDFGPGMVAAARRGAEARGLGNVECRVMDAQEIDLPDASVDGIVSRFGVMLCPEPARVLAGARRVLRDGGRVAYAVWGAPDRNPWLTTLVGAILQHGHQIEGDPFGAGGVFSLASPEANRELMAGAGFTDVRVKELAGTMRYDSVEEYWQVQTEIAGSLATLVSTLSADQVAAVRSTLESMVEPFHVDGGVGLPSLAIGVSGRA